ncbi:MAG: hypothetical protein A3F14_00335 [Gammaproteobacteria bacterium RIFCSPHIGHO2_12_FULL_43_28]|nr:MAG: hypothetical protein A3F14_00335 [Gammaproteobacteria bacterium RIFCSPHIGHO2_12_FULL_43_28]
MRHNNLSNKRTGVTLLEIMLVLALAAMVIILSVRYYTTSTSFREANDLLSKISAITAAADTIAGPTSSYTGVTRQSVVDLVSENSMTTPWGGAIGFTVDSARSYTVSIPGVPSVTCNKIRSNLSANPHFPTASMSACAAAGQSADFSYTYQADV